MDNETCSNIIFHYAKTQMYRRIYSTSAVRRMNSTLQRGFQMTKNNI